ncbi:tetratricopeptide repeat protein [Bradyrhizobium sp. McL0616]|uniref:tetratricopeptide repeat protein n=1 Tax=Bradyrhizobium sp. McL0616 TaxID=3415674 RepID=UPI003CF28F35
MARTALDLLELEQRALGAMNAGHMKEAAALYIEIIAQDSGWEHGTAQYCLAGCYEDLGELILAEECYRKALSYEPENPTFVDGLASFLHLHGSRS